MFPKPPFQAASASIHKIQRKSVSRYASSFTPEARVQAADLPAAWTAGLDRALQQELRRTFGPDAYGRFEPYRPTGAHCLGDADLGQGENSRQDAAHPSDPEALSILQERIRQGKRGHAPGSGPRPDQVAMIAVQALAGEDWGMKLLYADYQVIYAGAKAKKKALAYSFPAAGN